MQSACAILYCYLCPVRVYHSFLHYLINGTIFGKILKIKCFLIISTNFSKTFLVLRRVEGDIMYIGLHEKYPLFLSDFNKTRFFSTDFRKILMTDMTKVLSRFSQFCERA